MSRNIQGNSFRFSLRPFVLLLISIVSFSEPANPTPEAGDVSRAKLETAFIYQFTNYIEWSARDPAQQEARPFVITILGDSPIENEFNELSKAKKVKNRPIKVLRVASAKLISKESDIVFVATGSVDVLHEVVSKAKGSGALIVSDSQGFATEGAMINFFLDDGRLRFEINRHKLEGEHLVMSSQLLKLAKLVD